MAAMESSPSMHSPRKRFAIAGLAAAACAPFLLSQSQHVMVYDGAAGRDDRGNAIAVGPDSALYVAARTVESGFDEQFSVLKYDPLGRLEWCSGLAGAEAFSSGSANGIAVDAAGNSYVAGALMRPFDFLSLDFAAALASFDAAGRQRWIRILNGAGKSFERFDFVAIDAAGIYVAGNTAIVPTSDHNWLVARFSLSGEELWRTTLSGLGASNDAPVDIEIDPAGNLVVLGRTAASNGGPGDATVAKYDPQGNLLWRLDYSDTSASEEDPYDLAVDSVGNIYFTGIGLVGQSPESGVFPFAVKLAANGDARFVRRGQGFGGYSLDVHPEGGVVVSGEGSDASGNVFVATRFTTRLDGQGNVLWSTEIDSKRATVDIDGSVFLPIDRAELRVIKLDNSGRVVSNVDAGDGSFFDATIDEATGDFIGTGETRETAATGSSIDVVTARYALSGAPGPGPEPQPPAAPTSLSISASKRAIALGWSDNSSNENGFIVERAVNGGGFQRHATLGANARSFIDSGLNKRLRYSYRIKAFNADGESGYSNTASGSPR